MNYFDKLPNITYSGFDAKNLLARSKLSDATKNTRTVFYPYTMEEADRADIVSNLYYGNPGYSWLVWFANDVVDPYYDMPLEYNDFTKFIVSKYGSLERANRKIKYYRNNWADEADSISVTEYNALNPNYQKYYEPEVNMDYTPIAYRRVKDDTIVSTNRMITCLIQNVNGEFTVGEEIKVNSNNYAFVTFANTTAMTVQHVTGTIANTNVVVGQESGATATIQQSNTVYETLASTEPTFWSPVSYYQYEDELNSAKKEIVLLDVRYRSQAEEELKRTMKVI